MKYKSPIAFLRQGFRLNEQHRLLFHQNHFLCGVKVSGIDLIEIGSGSQVGCIKFLHIGICFLLFINQSRNELSEQVKYLQCNFACGGNCICDLGCRIEWIGIVLLKHKRSWQSTSNAFDIRYRYCDIRCYKKIIVIRLFARSIIRIGSIVPSQYTGSTCSI